ncbi:unnamed protein product [Chrysoparadoxa australica]
MEDEEGDLCCALCEAVLWDGVLEVKEHPIIPYLGVCRDCLASIAQGEKAARNEGLGEDEWCCWCSVHEEQSLFLCDAERCGRAVCKDCIAEKLGEEEVLRVEESANWHCYCCNEQPLRRLQENFLRVVENPPPLARVLKRLSSTDSQSESPSQEVVGEGSGIEAGAEGEDIQFIDEIIQQVRVVEDWKNETLERCEDEFVARVEAEAVKELMAGNSQMNEQEATAKARLEATTRLQMLKVRCDRLEVILGILQEALDQRKISALALALKADEAESPLDADGQPDGKEESTLKKLEDREYEKSRQDPATRAAYELLERDLSFANLGIPKYSEKDGTPIFAVNDEVAGKVIAYVRREIQMPPNNPLSSVESDRDLAQTLVRHFRCQSSQQRAELRASLSDEQLIKYGVQRQDARERLRVVLKNAVYRLEENRPDILPRYRRQLRSFSQPEGKGEVRDEQIIDELEEEIRKAEVTLKSVGLSPPVVDEDERECQDEREQSRRKIDFLKKRLLVLVQELTSAGRFADDVFDLNRLEKPENEPACSDGTSSTNNRVVEDLCGPEEFAHMVKETTNSRVKARPHIIQEFQRALKRENAKYERTGVTVCDIPDSNDLMQINMASAKAVRKAAAESVAVKPRRQKGKGKARAKSPAQAEQPHSAHSAATSSGPGSQTRADGSGARPRRSKCIAVRRFFNLKDVEQVIPYDSSKGRKVDPVRHDGDDDDVGGNSDKVLEPHAEQKVDSADGDYGDTEGDTDAALGSSGREHDDDASNEAEQLSHLLEERDSEDERKLLKLMKRLRPTVKLIVYKLKALGHVTTTRVAQEKAEKVLTPLAPERQEDELGEVNGDTASEELATRAVKLYLKEKEKREKNNAAKEVIVIDSDEEADEVMRAKMKQALRGPGSKMKQAKETSSDRQNKREHRWGNGGAMAEQGKHTVNKEARANRKKMKTKQKRKSRYLSDSDSGESAMEHEGSTDTEYKDASGEEKEVVKKDRRHQGGDGSNVQRKKRRTEKAVESSKAKEGQNGEAGKSVWDDVSSADSDDEDSRKLLSAQPAQKKRRSPPTANSICGQLHLKKSRLDEANREKAVKDRYRRLAELPRASLQSQSWQEGVEGSLVIDTLSGASSDGSGMEVRIAGASSVKGAEPRLKPHQTEGVKFLYDNIVITADDLNGGSDENAAGSGAILAHCMGLGKTLQVLTLVHTLLFDPTLRSIKRDNGTGPKLKTVLIVVPVNVLSNWVAEVAKWFKDMLAVKYELPVRPDKQGRISMLKEWHKNGGILFMSINLFSRMVGSAKGTLACNGAEAAALEDEEEPRASIKESKANDFSAEEAEEVLRYLVEPGPDVLVVDEAHLIKNHKTKTCKALSMPRTKRRVALTGSPLQNNLREFYVLVNFVRPGYLGTLNDFKDIFEVPIMHGLVADASPRELKLKNKRLFMLQELMKGFVNRKDASPLLEELPGKVELVLLVANTDQQKVKSKAAVKKAKENRGISGLLAATTYLWLIGAHPCLWTKDSASQEDQVQGEGLEGGDEGQDMLKDDVYRRSEGLVSGGEEEENCDSDSNSIDDFIDDRDEDELSEYNDDELFREEAVDDEELSDAEEVTGASCTKKKKRHRTVPEDDERELQAQRAPSDHLATATATATATFTGTATATATTTEAAAAIEKVMGALPALSIGTPGSRSVDALCASEGLHPSSSADAPTPKPSKKPRQKRPKERIAALDQSEGSTEHISLSGKLVVLLEILAAAWKKGDSVVVFSKQVDNAHVPPPPLAPSHRESDPGMMNDSKPHDKRRGSTMFRLPFLTHLIPPLLCLRYTTVLDLIERALMTKGWGGVVTLDPLDGEDQWGPYFDGLDFLRIHGATAAKKRQILVDKFNSDDRVKLFLVSTKAGNVGINLVKANRVVMMETDWNPASDLQAMFRCYRYGQKKKVTIYRLIAHAQLEEKIYARQVTKQGLAAGVIDDKMFKSMFNSAETNLFKGTSMANGGDQATVEGEKSITMDAMERREKWKSAKGNAHHDQSGLATDGDGYGDGKAVEDPSKLDDILGHLMKCLPGRIKDVHATSTMFEDDPAAILDDTEKAEAKGEYEQLKLRKKAMAATAEQLSHMPVPSNDLMLGQGLVSGMVSSMSLPHQQSGAHHHPLDKHQAMASMGSESHVQHLYTPRYMHQPLQQYQQHYQQQYQGHYQQQYQQQYQQHYQQQYQQPQPQQQPQLIQPHPQQQPQPQQQPPQQLPQYQQQVQLTPTPGYVNFGLGPIAPLLRNSFPSHSVTRPLTPEPVEGPATVNMGEGREYPQADAKGQPPQEAEGEARDGRDTVSPHPLLNETSSA